MRRRYIHIEPAVVRPRTRNQRKIPGQLADIANRTDHGVPSIRTMMCLKSRQWNLEVAGQQVSGANRHHCHRDPRLRQSVRNDPYRSIAPDSDDTIWARRNHVGRDGLARIVCRSPQPGWVAPPSFSGTPSDRVTQVIGHLDRVVDHRAATPRTLIHSRGSSRLDEPPMCRHHCNTRIGLCYRAGQDQACRVRNGRHAAWRLAGVISMPSTMVLIA
jgi:hypothetical protein